MGQQDPDIFAGVRAPSTPERAGRRPAVRYEPVRDGFPASALSTGR
jgi:hypothetical protein